MTHTMRRFITLWGFAALWLWTSAAWADVKDCKPWEAGCQFKAPDKIVSQCSFGEVEVVPGRCCGKGQTWDDKALVCRGEPVCDAKGGMEASGGACVPSTPWMVFHQQRCEQGYLGDCWRWARLSVPTLEDGGDSLRTLPATALGPVLRPLCERGIKQACAHLGAVLTAEEFLLRPGALVTLDAEGRTPAYIEGINLMRAACDAGVADGCYALAETRLMATRHRLETAFEDKEAMGLYERACELGHSAGCHRALLKYDLLEDAQLPRFLALKERACLGGPLPRCTEPFGDNHFSAHQSIHKHTARGIKTDEQAEALLIKQLRATHDGCLRGDLSSCAHVNWLPPQNRMAHHSPLQLDLAPRERILALARLAGAQTYGMQCRMGMVDIEDVCGLEAWLATKPKQEEVARALAFHDRLCDTLETTWRCATPTLAWRSHLKRSVLELFIRIQKMAPTHITRNLPSKRDALYRSYLYSNLAPYGFTREEVESFSATGRQIHAKQPPKTARISAMTNDMRALCMKTPSHYISCALAMGEAIRRGDQEGYKALRARLPTILERRGEPFFGWLTSNDYWEQLGALKHHCMDYGEHCTAYTEQLKPYEHLGKRLVDLPGEPRKPPKAAPLADIRAALEQGCKRFDASACAALGQWLHDATRYPDEGTRVAAALAYQRACLLGNGGSCQQTKLALLPEADRAKLLEIGCFSWRSNPDLCKGYVASAKALDLATRRALCERKLCEPLLEVISQDEGEREERLAALFKACDSGPGGKKRCEELGAELKRRDVPAVAAMLHKSCDALPERYRSRSGPCKVVATLGKTTQAGASCISIGLCERWLASAAPKQDKPLPDAAFLALRTACIAESRPACELLWRAWQAHRAPQLSQEQGRNIGAMACLLDDGAGSQRTALCEEIVQTRLIGKPDTAALEYAGTLRMASCSIVDDGSCEALRTMHKEGKLVTPVRELLIERLWTSCTLSQDQPPACKLLQELTR
jgi:hypothetical protein